MVKGSKYQRVKCRGTNKDGSPCKNWAIKGAKVCRMHGGGAKQVRRKARQNITEEKQRKLAEKAVKRYGLPIDIEPHQALMDAVHSTAGMTEYIRRRVAELEPEEIAGDFVVKTETGDNYKTVKAPAVNIWVVMLGEWEDRTARLSKIALDAGIAERQIRFIEGQAALFASALWAILEELGVKQGPESIPVVRRHLMAIKAGGAQLTDDDKF